MANIKSQIKRIKTNEKARQRNVSVKSGVKTAIKKVRLAVEEKDKAKAELALKNAVSLIDKAVAKGVVHKSTAARQKATIQILVNEMK